MNEHGPVAMGFQEYRQVITKFVRKHMKELDWQGREDGDDVWDKQAGHSSHTAGLRYGLGSDDLSGVSSDELLALFRASQEWYRLLGFEKEGRARRTGEGRRIEERPAATGIVDITERIECEGRRMGPSRMMTRIQPTTDGATTGRCGHERVGEQRHAQGTAKVSKGLGDVQVGGSVAADHRSKEGRVGDSPDRGREEFAILSAGDDGDGDDDGGDSSVDRGDAGSQVSMHRLRDQVCELGF